MKFIKQYLEEVKDICSKIDLKKIEQIVKIISNTRENKGRIFFIGVGGECRQLLSCGK